jgi:hypothetical protein
MPLSTSNFDERMPSLPWLKIFAAATFALFAWAGWMEYRLADLGYRATALDSKERWGAERARAANLGKGALILLGASRIQLGADLTVLRQYTGLQPVQLAIDGSSFVPVLEGLARDPLIKGTVLIDYYPGAFTGALNPQRGAPEIYEAAYRENVAKAPYFSLQAIEHTLTNVLHENLRSYADGSTPFTALQFRLLQNDHFRQYLLTLPDRSREANYRLVPMPGFYYRRVARNLGETLPDNLAAAQADSMLRSKIKQIKPYDNRQFIEGMDYVKSLINVIHGRGGRVVFVQMPTSGMVKEIDDKQFPSAQFWDVFVSHIGVPVLSADEIAKSDTFTCPDGSHLDFRDKARFSTVLGKFLHNRIALDGR